MTRFTYKAVKDGDVVRCECNGFYMYFTIRKIAIEWLIRHGLSESGAADLLLEYNDDILK